MVCNKLDLVYYPGLSRAVFFKKTQLIWNVHNTGKFIKSNVDSVDVAHPFWKFLSPSVFSETKYYVITLYLSTAVLVASPFLTLC